MPDTVGHHTIHYTKRARSRTALLNPSAIVIVFTN